MGLGLISCSTLREMLVKIAQVRHFLDGGRSLHWVSSPVGVNDVCRKAPRVVMGPGTEASAVPASRELWGSGVTLALPPPSRRVFRSAALAAAWVERLW